MARYSRWIFLIIFLLGAFLRFYHLPERTGFDADQEFYAFEAKKILIDHKLTLLGIPTSLGGLFVGPLYTYLVAFSFSLFRMEPIAGSFLAVFLNLVTILFLYLVTKSLFNEKTALLASFFWSISAQTIRYDITAWPVNPVNTLSLLFFLGLVRLKTDPKNWLIIGLASGLGLHFHLNVLIFLPIVFVYALFRRPKHFHLKFILAGFLLFLLFLSPLFLFNLRHDNLLLKNTLGLFVRGSYSFNPLTKFLFVGKVALENIAGLLFFNFKTWGSFLAFGLLLLFVMIKSKAKDLFLLFVFIGVSAFSFYPFHIPEYYLLPLNPILVIMVSRVTIRLWEKKIPIRFLALILLTMSIAANLSGLRYIENGLGMTYKKKVVRYILKKARGRPFSVSYFNETYLKDTGFSYLFYYFGQEPSVKVEKLVFNIHNPFFFKNFKIDERIGNFGVSYGGEEPLD